MSDALLNGTQKQFTTKQSDNLLISFKEESAFIIGSIRDLWE